jgi:hypothetical protein
MPAIPDSDMYARARVMGFYIILRARRLNWSKAALCATGRARTVADTNAVHDRLLQSMRVRFSDRDRSMVRHGSDSAAFRAAPS